MKQSSWAFYTAGNVWRYSSPILDELTAEVRPLDNRECGVHTVMLRYKDIAIKSNLQFDLYTQAIDFVNKLLGKVTRQLTVNSLRAKLEAAEQSV